MTHAEICPVCSGRQRVLSTLYQFGNSCTGVNEVNCRSCGGIGYIEVSD